MKNNFYTSILTALAFAPFFVAGAQTAISSFEELNTLVHSADFDYAGSYYLTNDIVIPEGTEWIPIGAPSDWPTNTTMTEFRGVFDGKGYSIKNLKITAGVSFCGFFGKLINKATIRNLGLENVDITGGNPTGGLAATMYGNEADMGGSQEAVTIEKVFLTGSVKGIGHVGGLVGRCNNNPKNFISNCYINATVEVTAAASPDAIAGGLVGCMKTGRGLKISNSYVAGTVTKTDNSFYTGGIFGGVAASNTNTATLFELENSAVILSTIANDETSDLFFTTTSAFMGNSTLSNNYARNDLGFSSSTNGYLQNQGEFLNKSFYETTLGWDFTNVWAIEDGVSYPTLSFNNVTAINNVAVEKLACEIYASTTGIEITTSGFLSLKIFDLTGKLLTQKQVSGSTIIPLAKGLYIIQMSNGNIFASEKALVK
jgi:hypothetical protein